MKPKATVAIFRRSLGRGSALSKLARSKRHKFLDGLCFLCDSRCGGKSVVALFPEQSVGETVFWMKANPTYQDYAANHLDTVLGYLKKSVHANTDGVRLSAEAITRRSIARSTQRVHNYRCRLSKLVLKDASQSRIEVSAAGTLSCKTRSERRSKLMSHIADALQQELEGLIALKYSHERLCEKSYKFRYQPAYEMLKREIADSSEDVWTRIRHHIGRLGQWHKMVASLVRDARSFALAVENYQVASIPPPEIGKRPSLTVDADLERLVLRGFPNYRGTSLCDELVTGISRSETPLTWFRSNKLVPRPHAETVALVFASSQGMRMVNDDRYIGCSKPSCYCCSLYMKYHPGGFRPRPTHGNVWVLWCLPQAHHLDQVDITSLSILRHMANETRDLTEAILTKGRAISRRKFDSTTGICTTLVRRS